MFARLREGGTLIAWGTVQAGPESLSALRRQPGDPELSPNFLKHSDEQTIAGLVAVLRARQSEALRGTDFTRWGVVAAPRHLGRQTVADVFARVDRRGPSGASPLVIPHRSLHSVSGTISEALGTHGPNLSVSGGPGNLAEGLLAALTLLNEKHLPGLWLVLTQWAPESALGTEAGHGTCYALALALTPFSGDRAGPRLRLLTAADMNALQDSVSLPELGTLHEVFIRPGRQVFRFEWGGGLEVEGLEVLAEIEA